MNTIQIKQSTVTAAPGTLLLGELAYSYQSGKLFIGNTTSNGVITIGGPGLLSTYALLTSPVFTGDPQAPTPLLSDNDTSIATTAFVKGQNYLTSNQNISITGDVTGSGSNAITLTLGSTGVVAGTYTKLTVDTKGRVTTGSVLTLGDIPTLTANKISDFDIQVRTNRLDQLASPTSNVSLNNQRISNLAEPVNPQDAATKAYVDAARSGLDVKQSVRVATVSNISITAPGTNIDGIVLSIGDRVLIKDQIAASENGIYVFQGATSMMTRATDADTDSKVTSGLFTFVTEGTINADVGYVLVTDDPIVLDTSNLSFGQFSGAGSFVAGDGITKVGNTLSVLSANSNKISVTSSGIDIASNYIGQTSITTLGSISLGTWQASVVEMQYGGTGSSNFPLDNIPYSDGNKLISSNNLKWDSTTNTMTINGKITSAVINGGSF